MTNTLVAHLARELTALKSAGPYKFEPVITSTQSSEIALSGGRLPNFCANNYLGLADNADLCAAAKVVVDRYGYRMPRCSLSATYRKSRSGSKRVFRFS